MTPQELAMLHSPWAQIFLPTVVSLLIVTLIALIRWLMSMGAWRYHPRGGSGFLWDEIVRIGIIFLPFVLIGIGIRYYFYILHPELKTSPYLYASLMLILVARIVLRRMPFAKAVAQHIDAARAQYRAVKLEGRA